jgi:two-component system, NarL family, response regulator DegU
MTITTERIGVMLLIKASLFRTGVEQALSSSDMIDISTVGDINEVPYVNHGLSHKVAIIDIDLPMNAGFTIARQLKLRLPETGIIALTSNIDDIQLLQILKAQASACLRKDASSVQLLETVIKVARGQHPIKEHLLTRPILADQVFRQFQKLSGEQDSKVPVTNLTDREIEILRWVSTGSMNKQIAQELYISEQTVKNHITSILRKMGVKSRQDAVALSKKQGVLTA